MESFSESKTQNRREPNPYKTVSLFLIIVIITLGGIVVIQRNQIKYLEGQCKMLIEK